MLRHCLGEYENGSMLSRIRITRGPLCYFCLIIYSEDEEDDTLNEDDIFVHNATRADLARLLVQPQARVLPREMRLQEDSVNAERILSKLRLLCISIHRDRQKVKQKIIQYYNKKTGE